MVKVERLTADPIIAEGHDATPRPGRVWIDGRPITLYLESALWKLLRSIAAEQGLTDMAGEMLADARTGKTGRHALVGLLLRWLRRRRWYWNVVSIVFKVWRKLSTKL